MKNQLVELHDSVLLSLVHESHELIVTMELVIHESDGIPGNDSGVSWYQPAVLRIANPSIDDGGALLPTTVMGGSYAANNVEHDNCIPLPITDGSINLLLECECGSRIVITGTALSLTLRGQRQNEEYFNA